MDGVQDISPKEVQAAIRTWSIEELPVDICRMQTEMTVVFEKMAEEFPVVQAGAVSCADASDDVGIRTDVVQSASDALSESFGAGAVDVAAGAVQSLPVATSVADGAAVVDAAAPSNPSSSAKSSHRAAYPRVDAPPVEDLSLIHISEPRDRG